MALDCAAALAPAALQIANVRASALPKVSAAEVFISIRRALFGRRRPRAVAILLLQGFHGRSTIAPPSMSLVPGSSVGGYEILAPLGAGGMGEVYRARDPKLRREVAIKVLPAAFAADADRVARFEREAHAVAALSHPNILAIHDFGTDRGITYAVMELLDGHSLRDAIGTSPMPRWKTIDYATQIAKGLEAAHARGIVHRDLKPENVFVSTAGHVKILDFGLAANRAPAHANTSDAETATVEGATAAGAIMGTAGYMSPEQVRGEAVDHRSDIFSFGCVVYEMLSGTRAFQGTSSIDTLHAILHSQPRDLSTLTAVPRHTRSHRRPKPGESARGTLSDGERSRVCPQRGRHYAGGIAARAAALCRGHHRADVALRGCGVDVEATVIDRFRRHPARCGSTGAPRHRRLTVRESRRHRPGVLRCGPHRGSDAADREDQRATRHEPGGRRALQRRRGGASGDDA